MSQVKSKTGAFMQPPQRRRKTRHPKSINDSLTDQFPKGMSRVWALKTKFATPKSESNIVLLNRRLRRARLLMSDATQPQMKEKAVAPFDPQSQNSRVFLNHRPQICSVPSLYNNVHKVEPGFSVDPSIALFHDCPDNNVSIRQIVKHSVYDGPQYMLSIRTNKFAGKYICLSYLLPKAFLNHITRRRTIAVQFQTELSSPLDIMARLNIKRANGIFQEFTELTRYNNRASAFFSLKDAHLPPDTYEKIWVDISFANPQNSKIILSNIAALQLPRK